MTRQITSTTSRPTTTTSRVTSPRQTTTTRRVISTLPSTTTRRPQLTTTTLRPQITRPSVQVTTQPINPSSRTVLKPTANSFWSEWSPTNDVEVLTNDVEVFTIPSTGTTRATNTNNSKVTMSPFLQDILNEALASNHISTTTQRPFERLVQVNPGVGFNSLNGSIGER